MKVYISGKITGEIDYRAKFDRAAEFLKKQGYEPVNPCDGEEDGREWEYYMKRDLAKLMECDAVFLLPDWRRSKGARIECAIAKDLGYSFIGIQPQITTKEERRKQIIKSARKKALSPEAKKAAQDKAIQYYYRNKEVVLERSRKYRHENWKHQCYVAEKAEIKKVFWELGELAGFLGYSIGHTAKKLKEGQEIEGFKLYHLELTGTEYDYMKASEK